MSHENTSPAIFSFRYTKGMEAGRQVGRDTLPSQRDHSCTGVLQATSVPPTLCSYTGAVKFPDVTSCSSLTVASSLKVRAINDDRCNLPPEKDLTYYPRPSTSSSGNLQPPSFQHLTKGCIQKLKCCSTVLINIYYL